MDRNDLAHLTVNPASTNLHLDTAPVNRWHKKHVVKLTGTLPSDNYMILVFHTHPKQPVLFTYEFTSPR